MTDKERKEKYMKKAYEKYSNIANQEELTKYAIELEKKNYFWVCAGCIVGAIFFFVLGIVLNSAFEETKMLLIVMSVSSIFEFFRTIGKYNKVENRYGQILRNIKHRKQLTRAIVTSDIKNSLSKDPDVEYQLCRVQLLDKEDEDDIGIMNEMYHKYYLHFKVEENVYRYKTKRQQYLDAAIGEVFYVAFVKKYGKIVAVYDAVSWEPDEELSKALYSCPVKEHYSETGCSYNPVCGNVKETYQEEKKPGKLFSVLSLICVVIAFLGNMFMGTLLALGALILAFFAVKKENTMLSKISLVISIIVMLFIIVLWWCGINYM